MRSRTSRGVPEWSGGEELYIGSPVSATGKVSGVTGIVPGPPEGSRGSTGWGHLSRRAPWAEVGGEPALVGWCAPLWAPLRLGLETLGGGRTTCLGGHSTPWPPPPLGDCISQGRRPPGDPIYRGGMEGSRTLALGASLPPCYISPSRKRLVKPCRDPCCIHHHAVVLLDLHQPLLPPCWIKKEETSLLRTCVERGGAVRSALGSSVIWITTSTTPSTPFS